MLSGAGADAPRHYVYFRFLKILVPSISVTYWKPFSIRLVASFRLLAVLTVYSFSSPLSNRWVD